MKVETQENSLYAPIRYEATRRYARSLGRLYVAHSNQGETTRIQFLQNDLLTRLREEVGRLGKPDGPGSVQSEIPNIQIYGKFDAGGRIIIWKAQAITT